MEGTSWMHEYFSNKKILENDQILSSKMKDFDGPKRASNSAQTPISDPNTKKGI